MSRPRAVLDTRIRHALEVHARNGIRADVDLWPRLEQEAIAQREIGAKRSQAPRSRYSILLVVVVCVAILTGGVAVAAAASPSLRHFLQETAFGPPAEPQGKGMDRHGRPVVMSPLPRFTLYYPQSPPLGLRYHGIGQVIPLRNGGANASWAGDGVVSCSRRPPQCLDPFQALYSPHAAGWRRYTPSLLIPFWRRSTRVVWFGFSGLNQRFVQIAEWDVATPSVKSLSRSSISAPNSRKSDTFLFLKKGRTTIAIETNLGATEARRLASSLQPLALPDP